MRKEQRIYCIEGIWNDGHRKVEPSVEPMLEILRRHELWNYARRDCATTGGVQALHRARMVRTGARKGPCSTSRLMAARVLSGCPMIILLGWTRSGTGWRGAVKIVSFTSVVVRSWTVMRIPWDGESRRSWTRPARWASRATPSRRVGTGRWAPALNLELMLFSSIKEEEIQLENGRHFQALRRIVEDLRDRFRDCGFNLYTRTRRTEMISLPISAVAGDEPLCRERRVPARRALRQLQR